MNRIRVSIAGAALAAGLGALQLIPVATVNPPVVKERTMQAKLQPPPHILEILNKACSNCHSNETRWPWYSKIAPVSWLMSRDVRGARKAMNFSEWTNKTGRKPSLALGALTAACADVKSGRMPLPPYRMLHPESRLSDAEKNVFCEWTATESREIMAAARGSQGRNP